MELPKIYSFIDNKYAPLLSYLFILPSSEFLTFLTSIKNKAGCVREFHGFDFESARNCVEFWDDSSEAELTIEIPIRDLLSLLDPLIFFFKEDIAVKGKIEFLIKEIENDL